MTRLLDLDAYVTGELADPAADALDEAMFDAPDDPDLQLVDRIARLGAILVEHGTYDVGITKSHLDKVIAAGHVVQICDAGPPGKGSFVIRKDAEFVVTRLPLGRTDHERVDVDVTVIKYDVTKTIKDVLVDPIDGVINAICERPLAELAFGTETIVRVRERSGERKQLAEWHLVGSLAP